MGQRESDRLIKALRDFGLRYPGAHLKSPWPGHEDLAVNDKTFCYLPPEGQPFSISCKLPRSCDVALSLPFSKPTGYGLGRSGWVSASFEDHALAPMALFEEWIDESYRAQAPKRLVRELDARDPASDKRAETKKKVAKKRVAKKKVTKKKVTKKK